MSLKEFNIHFGRLKPGKHHFSWEVNGDFFENFEHSLITECSSKLKLEIEKNTETLMVFRFSFNGELTLPCDRCLENKNYSLEGNQEIYVKLEGQRENDDEDILYLPPDSYEYNISSLVYDFYNLSVPIKKECLTPQKKSCRAVEKHFHTGANEQKNETDPRWNELKKLL